MGDKPRDSLVLCLQVGFADGEAQQQNGETGKSKVKMFIHLVPSL